MSRLVLPICVLGMLGGFLLPLPAALLDALLVCNVAIALILFFSVLYLERPLQLSALPGILLLLTLFRLALNVSTTRVILGHGPVSQVIEAFGHVVIQDQIAVGVCIFLIVTLIQFIVIAKGSERVAEVSARFMLDAMPGRQMAIDADVRSGFLSAEEARDQRTALQTESRFYGALDGAMKFIKGDAIAGLFITSLNVIGGLGLGVFSYGLGIEQALSQYTMLTIGDGLCSQFPALLNSLTAGMMVTRVQCDDNTLARELLEQLAGSSVIRFFIGCVLFALACLSGFPFLPLAIPGMFLCLSALHSTVPGTTVDVEGNKESAPGLPMLQLSLHESIAHTQHAVTTMVQEECRSLFLEHGLLIDVPTVVVGNDESISFRLELHGQAIYQELFTSESPSLERIRQRVRQRLYMHRCDLIDDRMVRKLLLYAEHVFHDQIAQIVPGVVSVTQCTVLLRNLLRGGLSVRHLDLILQAIAEQEGKECDEEMLLQAVRQRMVAYISQQVAPDGVLRGITFSAELDRHIVAIASGKTEGAAALSAVLHDCAQMQGQFPKVLVVSSRARHFLEDLYRLHGGHGYVVSHEELLPSVTYCCEVLEMSAMSPAKDDEQIGTSHLSAQSMVMLEDRATGSEAQRTIS